MNTSFSRQSEAQLTAKAQDLGIPDWRDEDAYPAPDELSMDEWRWEFLRRNAQYREDFARSEDSFTDESKARYFERVYKLGHPVDPQRSVRDILSAEPEQDDFYFGNEFGDIVRFVDTCISNIYSPLGEIDERFSLNQEDYGLYLRINLRRPLPPQFEKFVEIAEISQKSWNQGKRFIRRPNIKKWPLYLRVLDARSVGATYKIIAHELLIHQQQTEQAARDILGQAKKIQGDLWSF